MGFVQSGRNKAVSDKPAAVKRRLRRTDERVRDRDFETGLLYPKPVSEWDFEELQRGRPRKENGDWYRGKKPKWLDDIVMAEVRQRLKIMARDELSVYTGSAIQCLIRLMMDEEVDDDGKPRTSASVKLQAATYIMDQVIGKATTPLEISRPGEVRELMASIMVNADGQEAHPIIEGTYEEVDDDGE